MKHRSTQKSVINYYSRLDSRLGYILVMGRSQHFGYYDDSATDERSAQNEYHKRFAKLLKLKKGLKVLDAGCGQGVVACYLAKEYGVEVTGITIVPREVKVAQKIATKAGLSKAHFVLADYASPPFAPGSFDRIYTTESLSHAPDVSKVLGEFYKLLKPGGRLVCAEYEFDFDGPDQVNKAAEYVRQRAAIHGIYQFGLGQFRQSLKKARFEDLQEYDWTPHMLPSFERIRRLAAPVTTTVKKLRLQRFFVNQVAAEMYAQGTEEKAFFYKVYVGVKPSR